MECLQTLGSPAALYSKPQTRHSNALLPPRARNASNTALRRSTRSSASSSSSARRLRRHQAATTGTVNTEKLLGEDPEWTNEDFLTVGLANCFRLNENGKITPYFVIEPITAQSFECMHIGGETSFKYVFGTNLGTILAMDASLLPEEFREGHFCDNLDKRSKAAARTWLRPFAQENTVKLVPPGVVLKDFNFNLDNKRVLDAIFEVKDEDNIKQDLSIDVYGRKKDPDSAPENDSLIKDLYNA